MRNKGIRQAAQAAGVKHAALRAWQAANRYNFRVEFVKQRERVAAQLLEEMFIYYHNYRKLIAPRR